MYDDYIFPRHFEGWDSRVTELPGGEKLLYDAVVIYRLVQPPRGPDYSSITREIVYKHTTI